jgi:hypothetical protein
MFSTVFLQEHFVKTQRRSFEYLESGRPFSTNRVTKSLAHHLQKQRSVPAGTLPA